MEYRYRICFSKIRVYNIIYPNTNFEYYLASNWFNGFVDLEIGPRVVILFLDFVVKLHK